MRKFLVVFLCSLSIIIGCSKKNEIVLNEVKVYFIDNVADQMIITSVIVDSLKHILIIQGISVSYENDASINNILIEAFESQGNDSLEFYIQITGTCELCTNPQITEIGLCPKS